MVVEVDSMVSAKTDTAAAGLRVETQQAPTSIADYTGIESVRSQEFSVAIFVFMLLAVILFAGIALAFMLGKRGQALKTGEKWLFAWIFLGIVVSVIFGALQLLGGYLF